MIQVPRLIQTSNLISWTPLIFTMFNGLQLEVLVEKGSAAVTCDANRTKTLCRTVEHKNFFY